MRVAVLSDTHGLLRPEVLTAIAEADQILHAGDVGSSHILQQLAAVAPLVAVRGNVDTHGLCAMLPASEAVELAGQLIYLLHRIEDLDLDPVAAGVRMVISGHSHRPAILWKRDVLYLNPGSVGPRRFNLPVTMAFLDVSDSGIVPEIVMI